MKYYVINSSPRKNYNTSQLLEKVVELYDRIINKKLLGDNYGIV